MKYYPIYESAEIMTRSFEQVLHDKYISIDTKLTLTDKLLYSIKPLTFITDHHHHPAMQNESAVFSNWLSLNFIVYQLPHAMAN